MRIDHDPGKGTVRITDGGCGAVFFILDGAVDPARALFFEAGESGRCVFFDTPPEAGVRGRLLEAMREYAHGHGLDVTGEG